MATVNVIVSLDGTIQFAVEQGEFSPAQIAIQQAIEGLKLEGIDFAEIGEIERHRHDKEHEQSVQAHG